MLKSKKFLLGSFGLISGLGLLIVDICIGNYDAFDRWARFFMEIFLIFTGANQLQKFIAARKDRGK